MIMPSRCCLPRISLGNYSPVWTLSFLSVLCLLPHQTQGLPFYVLENTATKCMTLDVGQETVATITYDVPDLKIYGEKDDPKDRKGRKNYATNNDVVISASMKENNKYGWDSSKLERGGRRGKATGTGKLRQIVEMEKGEIDFYTGNQAGFLEICIQSYKASPSQPRRVLINLTKRLATEQEKMQNAPIQKDQKKFPDKDVQNSILTVQTSHISVELENFEKKMKEIMSNTGASKDINQEFKDKSVKLNKAITFWPTLRIVAVIIAGFFQAHLVVSYMKSKHIY